MWHWRGMFDLMPLPLAWPVYVSYAEASAYAKWRGLRLPSEAEYQRAAYGTPDGGERRHPWGSAEPSAERGVFDLPAGIPSPRARIRRAGARGAPTISSATAGSGRAPCSRRFLAFALFLPIPSTRPISSMVNTSS